MAEFNLYVHFGTFIEGETWLRSGFSTSRIHGRNWIEKNVIPQTSLPNIGNCDDFSIVCRKGCENIFFLIYERETCPCCAGRFGHTQTTGIWVTHKKKNSTGKNKFKENVKAYALLFVFQSQRGKCHCGGKKNVLLFPSFICYKKRNLF